MEIIDFEFKRERKLGEFVQDFINLLKIIYKHLIAVLFQLLIIPICFIVLIGYYLSTQLSSNSTYTDTDYFNIFLIFGSLGLIVAFICLIAMGFAIEYFILLRDKKSIDFSSLDILNSFKNHLLVYIRFFFALIIVTILAAVPIGICMFLSALIPIVGSFAVGIFLAIVGLWYFTSFMLYREGYADLMDCFGVGFSLLRSKVLEYGIASYVVSFIFQSLISVMMIIPSIIIFLLAYNYVGFNVDFFDSAFGKFITTFGTLLLSSLFIIYYMLSIISYGIIYETAKELKYGEDVFQRIVRLGGADNA